MPEVGKISRIPNLNYCSPVYDQPPEGQVWEQKLMEAE